ncbi:chloride channel protein [Skermania piniformis]|uniref:Chloride channel protein n=1 Tax=Skermania pinensis TaxID=39122 RepID=A0ABX8S7M6_9ACTN|nr:chloride channel protein [Skermania piniformis]QXQ13848.1 chloride channel protein [Skermania piniformis]
MKPIVTATVYGFVAGFVTYLMLVLTHLAENLIWSRIDDTDHVLVFCVVMAGGLLIALLRYRDPTKDFDGQLKLAENDEPAPIPQAANMAALGVSSFGFGGAIGPEGGVIAVVEALSDFVALRISKDVRQRRLIREVGVAGSLGAMYGSPPGGASYADSDEAGTDKVPWPLLFLAGTLGLAGIYLGGALFPSDGPGLKIPVPEPTAATDFATLVALTLPALVGAVAAIVYLVVKLYADRVLARVATDIRVRVLIGSCCFALLIAIWPVMRSNGQEQLVELSADPGQLAAAILVGIMLLKAVAMALCLAAGWLGGPIMPLAFMGVCGGLAVSQAIPGIDPGLAAIAGAGAAACVGMNKPLVALLVLLFLTTHPAPVAIAIGVGIGVPISIALPKALSRHAGHH